MLCLSHCPYPESITPPLVGFRTCDWWRRGGFVVTAPVPIHQRTWALYSASHLRWGQFLHLQTVLEKLLEEFAFILHFRHIFCNFSRVSLRSHRFRADSSASFGEGSVGVWLEFLGGSLRSLFIHFIGWVPLLDQKHGSTNLQNRWKRGSCGRKTSRRCSCCSKDKRTGNLRWKTQILIDHAKFWLNLVMCCVDSVLHIPCSAPHARRLSGKVATCIHFHRRVHCSSFI